MKNYKKLSNIIIILLLFIITMTFARFCIYDPFYFFKKLKIENININKDNTDYPYNNRYLELKYIIQNSEKYDSFLFGASSASNIILDNESGGKWYIYTPAVLSLWEVDRTIKELVKNKVKIKNLAIELSDENLKNTEEGSYIDICKARPSIDLYPVPMNFEEKIYFFGNYLCVFPVFGKISNKIQKIFHKTAIIDDIPINVNSRDNSFSMSKKELKYRLPMIENKFPPEKLNEIARISDFAKQNNINLIFFISPVYFHVYEAGNLKEYNELKFKIAKITPFYDFSGLNSITYNKNYFIDLIHGNEDCANIMKKRMFNSNKNDLPKIKDFGVFVTTFNINNHIETMNNQMLLFKKNHPNFANRN